MQAALRQVLEGEPDVAYALLFGSGARGTAHADRDADVAIELRPGAACDVRALGGLAARLESATGRPIDLVLLQRRRTSRSRPDTGMDNEPSPSHEPRR